MSFRHNDEDDVVLVEHDPGTYTIAARWLYRHTPCGYEFVVYKELDRSVFRCPRCSMAKVDGVDRGYARVVAVQSHSLTVQVVGIRLPNGQDVRDGDQVNVQPAYGNPWVGVARPTKQNEAGWFRVESPNAYGASWSYVDPRTVRRA